MILVFTIAAMLLYYVQLRMTCCIDKEDTKWFRYIFKSG